MENQQLSEKWLPVLDYAVNKRVSISTLRRRIKSQTLEHRLENGRYLIRTEIETDDPHHFLDQQDQGESLAMVQSLVGELKKAYGLLLAEKEEMIQQLKSEIDTLKHINQFLELQILNEGPQEAQSGNNLNL